MGDLFVKSSCEIFWEIPADRKKASGRHVTLGNELPQGIEIASSWKVPPGREYHQVAK